MTVSFDNTENAFAGKSDSDIRRSYWLFRIIGNQAVVRMGSSLSSLALALGMKPLIKATIYRQFVGGETIDDCEHTIARLAKYNIGTILDYSVEGKESETDFERCFNETLSTIRKANGDQRIPFCVFKVTGLARLELLRKFSASEALTAFEKKEWELVQSRVQRICQAAFEADQPIFIDAEESWIQKAIDELADANMALCNKLKPIVYNTYQLYRHDRLQFLSDSIQKAKTGSYHLGAKLVRGAYMEKERERAAAMRYSSPIQPDKQASDRDYDAAVKLCLDNISMVGLCAGTHNEQSSLKLVELMQERQIAAADRRIYFSQLLGMSDHISYNLSLAGYNVAKYVPYGPVKDVLPYLIRRAQENTSVKGQTGREFSLIIREKRRRRTASK